MSQTEKPIKSFKEMPATREVRPELDDIFQALPQQNTDTKPITTVRWMRDMVTRIDELQAYEEQLWAKRPHEEGETPVYTLLEPGDCQKMLDTLGKIDEAWSKHDYDRTLPELHVRYIALKALLANKVIAEARPGTLTAHQKGTLANLKEDLYDFSRNDTSFIQAITYADEQTLEDITAKGLTAGEWMKAAAKIIEIDSIPQSLQDGAKMRMETPFGVYTVADSEAASIIHIQNKIDQLVQAAPNDFTKKELRSLKNRRSRLLTRVGLISGWKMYENVRHSHYDSSTFVRRSRAQWNEIAETCRKAFIDRLQQTRALQPMVDSLMLRDRLVEVMTGGVKQAAQERRVSNSVFRHKFIDGVKKGYANLFHEANTSVWPQDFDSRKQTGNEWRGFAKSHEIHVEDDEPSSLVTAELDRDDLLDAATSEAIRWSNGTPAEELDPAIIIEFREFHDAVGPNLDTFAPQVQADLFKRWQQADLRDVAEIIRIVGSAPDANRTAQIEEDELERFFKIDWIKKDMKQAERFVEGWQTGVQTVELVLNRDMSDFTSISIKDTNNQTHTLPYWMFMRAIGAQKIDDQAHTYIVGKRTIDTNHTVNQITDIFRLLTIDGASHPDISVHVIDPLMLRKFDASWLRKPEYRHRVETVARVWQSGSLQAIHVTPTNEGEDFHSITLVAPAGQKQTVSFKIFMGCLGIKRVMDDNAAHYALAETASVSAHSTAKELQGFFSGLHIDGVHYHKVPVVLESVR